MTPHERDLILGVAQRLRDTRLPEKDLDADRLIRAEIGSQPDALYLLTQLVIVQQEGLRQAGERLRQAEAGGQAPVPTVSPAGGGGSVVGSFLTTAAAAAAGVVGGQFILDGLRHWAGGLEPGHHGPGGSFLPGGGEPGTADVGGGGYYAGVDAGAGDFGAGGDFGDEPADDVEGGGDFGEDDGGEPPDEDAEGGDIGGGGDF